MVWTTTSASHSFSHSGLCSSAPVAAWAASPSSCGLGLPSGVARSGASSSFGAVPSPSCGAAAGASSSCGGAGASSSCAPCAAAAGAGACSSCAAAAGASACAAASAGPSCSCGGAGGWAGGSPWGFFFFEVGGLDRDIYMVFVKGSMGRGRGPQSHRPRTSPTTTSTCPTPHMLCFWLRTPGSWA